MPSAARGRRRSDSDPRFHQDAKRRKVGAWPKGVNLKTGLGGDYNSLLEARKVCIFYSFCKIHLKVYKPDRAIKAKSTAVVGASVQALEVDKTETETHLTDDNS